MVIQIGVLLCRICDLMMQMQTVHVKQWPASAPVMPCRLWFADLQLADARAFAAREGEGRGFEGLPPTLRRAHLTDVGALAAHVGPRDDLEPAGAALQAAVVLNEFHAVLRLHQRVPAPCSVMYCWCSFSFLLRHASVQRWPVLDNINEQQPLSVSHYFVPLPPAIWNYTQPGGSTHPAAR